MKHNLSWQRNVGGRIDVGYRRVDFNTLDARERECKSVAAKKRSY
jgi:hypothetical protein